MSYEERKPLILIVEDDRSLNTINRRALESEGYAIVSAYSAAEARELLSQNPDLLLLDVKLPDGSGFDLCREIRETTNAHIIFLTSVTESSGELEGLRAGGNDYLRKPYGIELLRERVKTALRGRGLMGANTAPPQTVVKGRLTLDTVARRAMVDGKDVNLRPMEYGLLLFLIRNEGQAMNAETIYEKVWGQPMGEDRNAIQVAVARLRKKLENTGYSINSAYGRGYAFEPAKN